MCCGEFPDSSMTVVDDGLLKRDTPALLTRAFYYGSLRLWITHYHSSTSEEWAPLRSTDTHTHRYTHTHTHTRMHTSTHARTHARTHTHTHAHTDTHAHTHTHTHTHTLTHTHTHTHRRMHAHTYFIRFISAL